MGGRLIQAAPTALAEGAAFMAPTVINKVLIGERGPEYVLPETRLINIVRAAFTMPRFSGAPAMVAAMAGGGVGGNLTMNLNGPLIATTGVSRRDLAEAAEEFVAMTQRQMRRVGRSL